MGSTNHPATDDPAPDARSTQVTGGTSASGNSENPKRPTNLDDALAAAGIILRLQGRRADVVLNDPERHNPQSAATWHALALTCDWLEGRTDVVVISGAGPSFSAGLDRRAFTPQGLPGQPSLFQLATASDQDIDSTIEDYQRGFACWRRASFLTIAAVQGHAIGAGFQLALACDLRIAADDVRFAMREPQLGLVPDLTGTHTLVQAVGYARALQICATGRVVDATEALHIGLVQEVVPADQLTSAVDTAVATLATGSIQAILATRALLRGAVEATPEQQYAAERTAQRRRLRALASEYPQRSSG